jgi:hypothetical protein
MYIVFCIGKVLPCYPEHTMYIIFLRAEILGLDFAKVFTMIGFNGLFFEFNCADMKFNINFLYRFLSFHGDWIRAYKLVLYT